MDGPSARKVVFSLQTDWDTDRLRHNHTAGLCHRQREKTNIYSDQASNLRKPHHPQYPLTDKRGEDKSLTLTCPRPFSDLSLTVLSSFNKKNPCFDVNESVTAVQSNSSLHLFGLIEIWCWGNWRRWGRQGEVGRGSGGACLCSLLCPSPFVTTDYPQSHRDRPSIPEYTGGIIIVLYWQHW